MQAVLTLPEEGLLDCLTCSFVRQKELVVAAYSDGRAVVWDLTSLNEVQALCALCLSSMLPYLQGCLIIKIQSLVI